MDLTFGKEELAFQQEVRGWLKENLTPEIVGEIEGRPERLHAQGAADRLAEAPGEEGLAVHRLAQGIRRAGLHHDAEVHLRDGDGEGGRARAPRRSAPRCARR